MLWGAYARNLKKFLHNPAHLILECNHPSPLSANHGGWFNNGHFKKANEFLIQNGLTPIDWCKQKE
jgi:uracil-DNA glycosylase